MKIRLTIGRKIGFGFAALLILTSIVFVFTYDTLKQSRTINDQINQVYNPSVAALEQLKSTVHRSRTLITMWAFHQSREDTEEKKNLLNIVNKEIPDVKKQLDSLSVRWETEEQRSKQKIYDELNKLLQMYAEVRNHLPNMRSYDDPGARFKMNVYAEEGGVIYEKSREVMDMLNNLIDTQQKNTKQDSVTMLKSFNTLENYLRNFGLLILVIGIIIAFFTVRSIVKPVSELKEVLLTLGRGKFPGQKLDHYQDEIGEMSRAMNQLVDGLRRTTEFSKEVGRGKFNTEFVPLSDDDVLGHALLKMRDSLKISERNLEEKVEARTKEVVKQKNKIEKQNIKVVELYKNITDSIRYAKRLQEGILPSSRQIGKMFDESFVFYKPKDIVSGDFYYFRQRGNKIVFAAVDCTGHGVPGAFMSLVGHNALNKAVEVNEQLNPGVILKDLSTFSAAALNRNNDGSSGRDGMDLALCTFDTETRELIFAGSYSPLYLVRDKEIMTFKGSKIPIGSLDYEGAVYESHVIQTKPGDMIYIFSDGYVDQFGGKLQKKFMYKPFRNLLTDISDKPATVQLKEVNDTLIKWKGGIEQVDDILIIGVRV